MNSIKAELAKTASESRVLGQTTFIKEAIKEFDTLEDDEFQLLFEFWSDKYYIAPNGGAIAVAHNRSKNSSGYCTALNVYDSNCKLISCFPLHHDNVIKELFVTPEECIIVAYVDCHIESYNLDGKLIAEVSEYDGMSVGLKFYAFWSTGVMLCTDNNVIYIIDNFVTLKPRLFCKFSGPSSLKNGTVIPPDPMTGVGYQLWCTLENKMVALIQSETEYECDNFVYPVEQIIFSPNKKIALALCYEYDNSPYPTIYCFCKPDLSGVILTTIFDNPDFIPEKVLWCGSDAIMLTKGLDVALIGATSDAIKWKLPSECACTSEVDGARVFTKKGSYLFRAITKPVFQFSIWNEKSPQVRLFHVISDDNDIAKSDIVINPDDDAKTEGREFTIPQLKTALDGIIEAALFFNSSIVRSNLMKMASRIMRCVKAPEDDQSYVKERLVRIYNYTDFADKMSLLRTVEQLKTSPYNIPVTFAQYEDLNSIILLKRLCNRRIYREAFKLSQYIGVDDSYIKSHWATNLVTTSSESDVIAKKIAKMGGGIDYVDMAKTAFANNRSTLGMKLLEENKAKSRAVPLLLERGEWEEALKAALVSYESSLIMFTFETLKREGQKKIIKEYCETSKLCRDAWILYNKGKTSVIKKTLNIDGRDSYYNVKDEISNHAFANLNQALKTIAGVRSESNLNYRKMTAFFIELKTEVKELIEKERIVDNYDELTPYEIFEQAILTNNRKIFAEVGGSRYFGLTDEEIFWRRVLCGVKYDSVAVLTKVKKAIKGNQTSFYTMILEYVNEHGSERAKRIFNDPDGEKMEIPSDDPVNQNRAKDRKSKKKEEPKPEEAPAPESEQPAAEQAVANEEQPENA